MHFLSHVLFYVLIPNTWPLKNGPKRNLSLKTAWQNRSGRYEISHRKENGFRSVAKGNKSMGKSVQHYWQNNRFHSLKFVYTLVGQNWVWKRVRVCQEFQTHWFMPWNSLWCLSLQNNNKPWKPWEKKYSEITQTSRYIICTWIPILKNKSFFKSFFIILDPRSFSGI